MTSWDTRGGRRRPGRPRTHKEALDRRLMWATVVVVIAVAALIVALNVVLIVLTMLGKA